MGSWGIIVDMTEMVKAQKQLRESEDTIEASCKFAGVWTWNYDVSSSICYPGRKLQEDFDLPTQIENYPDSSMLFHDVLPEYRAVCHENMERIRQGEPEVNYEIQVRYPDGGKHWLRFRINTISYENGKPKTAVGSAQEIDNEKALEARIEMERRKQVNGDKKLLWYTITNLSKNELVEQKRMPGLCKLKGYQRIMEYTEHELFQRICMDKAKEKYTRTHETEYLISRYYSGETTLSMEFQYEGMDGKIRWVSNVVNLLRDPSTGDIYAYEYFYDIHEQKMVEEIMTVAVYSDYECFGGVDLKNNQITVVKKKEQEPGTNMRICSYYEEVSEYWKNVYEPDQEVTQQSMMLPYVQKRLEEEGFFAITHRYLEKGEIRTKKIGYTYYDQERKICLLTCSDITNVVKEEEQKRKELAKALQQAKRATQIKDEFLSRMSHDMRTPMNAIIGLIALTFDEAKNPKAVQENMTKMRSASDFMAGLVNDILDMARIEAGSVKLHPEPYRYEDFVMNMRTMFLARCQQKGVTLTIEEKEKMPTILADKVRLNQIFFNVLSNAVNYTNAGGSIRYHVENLEIMEKTLACDYVIEDTGIGMSKEFQKHMFEAFVQEDTTVTAELHGSGLGLSITNQLVEMMGGTIEVDSEINRGTRVTIHLSFARAREENSAALLSKKKSKANCCEVLQNKTVLLVEDHPLNAQIAQKLLEKVGIQVVYAENGRIAVEKFVASKESEFDVILMDIRMPEMSGLEATRRIRGLERADARTVPILAMSANAYEEDVEKSLEAGMNAHLAKPVVPKVLYDTLTEILE